MPSWLSRHGSVHGGPTWGLLLKWHKRRMGGDGCMLLISQKLAMAGFLIWTWLLSMEEELGSSLSLGMAAVVFGGALIFTLSTDSWLQCKSLSILAHILYPTSTDLLVSTTELGAFLVQILDAVLNETLLWALGLWQDLYETLPRGLVTGFLKSLVHGHISCTFLHLIFWVNFIK